MQAVNPQGKYKIGMPRKTNTSPFSKLIKTTKINPNDVWDDSDYNTTEKNK